MTRGEVLEFELKLGVTTSASLSAGATAEPTLRLTPGTLLELMLHVAASDGEVCLRDVRIRRHAVAANRLAFLVVDQHSQWLRVECRWQEGQATRRELYAYARIAAHQDDGTTGRGRFESSDEAASGASVYSDLLRYGLAVPDSEQCIQRLVARGSVLDGFLALRSSATDVSVMPSGLLVDAGFHCWFWAAAAREHSVSEADIVIYTVRLSGDLPMTTRARIETQPSGGEADIVYWGDAGGRLLLRGVHFAPDDSPFMSEPLLDVVRSLSGKADVALGDNLFRIGCSSLDVMRLQCVLRDSLGVQLDAATIYRYPVLRDLAPALGSTAGANAVEDDLPSLVPVTRAQAQLWSIDAEQTSRGLYNELFVFTVTGQLSVAALQRALDRLIEAHSALRTVILMHDGILVQRVAPAIEVPVQEVTVVGDIAQVSRNFAATPFELEHGPLLRAALVSSSSAKLNRHLILAVHHAIIDEWSANTLLMRDLPAAYVSTFEPLSESPRDFRHHAWREYVALRDSAWSEDLAWWQAKVAPCSALALPRKIERALSSDRAECVDLNWDPSLWATIRDVAENVATTPHRVFLACLFAVAARFSGSSYLAIGVPAANRSEPDVQDTVGMFTNLLPVALSVEWSLSVRDWIGRVSDALTESLARQHVPFAEIAKRSGFVRDGHSLPLVEIALVWRTEEPVVQIGNATMTPVDIPSSRCKFDIELQVVEQVGVGLRARICYRTDAFEAAMVRSFTSALERFTRRAASMLSQPVSTIDLVDAQQREDMLVRWNGTQSAFPDTDVIGLFAAQARSRPGAPAIRWNESIVSYKELFEEVQRICNVLVHRGVGRGSRVGLCLDRTPNAIAAMLAVLASGAAYVPMTKPVAAARLRSLARSADLGLVIVSSARDVEAGDLDIVTLDDLLHSRTGPVATSGFLSSAAEDVAYILHTSGSTGEPKGVVVPHRVVSALVCWAREIHSDEELAGVLASTSFTFDMSVFEIFAPLATGGALILVDSILDLETSTAREQVTLINTVPTALRQLLRGGAIPQSVRCINAAGEPLPRELVDRLYSETSVARIHDVYGPTETNCATLGVRERGERPHVGRPLANASVYILDEAQQPVPPYAVGEVWIGGPGVALGYTKGIGDAARFLPDRFRGSGQLYRSGDLGRYREDGTIELLGRRDRQVKVRGMRIELEEVEIFLALHPQVLDCAVEVSAEGSALGALIVPRESGGESSLTLAIVRAWLAERLPPYAAPDALVFTQDIPRTSSGKTDRSAVKAMLANRARRRVGPRTQTERSLSRLWHQVLGIDDVSVEATLAELGADSLAVTQFVHAAAREGRPISVGSVYECQTIAALAERVADVGADASDPSAAMSRDCELLAGETFASRPHERSPVSDAAPVLLTGATGFLGAHMLVELLRQEPARDVYCLIRGSSEADRLTKLKHRLERYGARLPREHRERVQIIAGDLDNLGLGVGRVLERARVATAYHVAAAVDFARPYSELRKTNVCATAELLRLCMETSVAEFHYISSLGVSGRSGSALPWQALRIGYLQTKWVAEQLVLKAGQSTMRTKIHRPGRIVWDSQSGAMAIEDLLVRTIRDIVHLGIAFDPGDLELDHMAGVDSVAAALVTKAVQGRDDERTVFSFYAGTLRVKQIWDWLSALGYQFDEVSYATWRARIVAAGRDSWVLPVLAVLGDGERPTLWTVAARDESGEECASEVSLNGLDYAGFSRMVRWLVLHGHLPEPSSDRRRRAPMQL